jgi:hypothetical protein
MTSLLVPSVLLTLLSSLQVESFSTNCSNAVVVPGSLHDFAYINTSRFGLWNATFGASRIHPSATLPNIRDNLTTGCLSNNIAPWAWAGVSNNSSVWVGGWRRATNHLDWRRSKASSKVCLHERRWNTEHWE